MAINPGNATPITLSFAVATGSATTDALGNPVRSSSTVTAAAFVTPLSTAKLQQVQAGLGVDRMGIPVKVRCKSSTGLFPSSLTRGKLLEPTCTYGGRPARIAMVIGEPPSTLAGMGLLTQLGQSVEGLLTYIN